MKKRIIWMATLLFIMVAVSGLEISDVFKELKTNDANLRESIIAVDNIGGAVPLSKLGISYNEVCGHVNDVEILLKQQCEKQVLEYYVENELVCSAVFDEDKKTFWEVCNNQDVTKKRFVTEYQEDYCYSNTIPIGENDYKLQFDISPDKCGDGWGYEIDWIPSLELADKSVITQPEWAWFNSSWLSKYPITYTCNNPTDCQEEFIAINYTGTDCGVDLRVVYNDAEFVPYEIDNTLKFVYTLFNGTFNTSTELYSLYCNNTNATDASDSDLKLFYEDCEDVSDFLLEDAGSSTIESLSGNETNRTNHGNFCSINVTNTASYDWIYQFFDSDDGDRNIDTGRVFFTGLWFPIFNGASQFSPVFAVRGQLGDDGTHIARTDANIRDYSGGWHVICTGCATEGWHVMKTDIILDADDDYTFYWNHVPTYFGNLRTDSGWNGSINKVTLGAVVNNVEPTSYYDEIVVSRYNLSIYQDGATIVLGSKEVESPPDDFILDLIFVNSTGHNTTVFNSGEHVRASINLTNRNVTINDSTCEVRFPNGIDEVEANDSEFSLCNTGCDFSTYEFNITDLDTVDSQEDTIRFSICHQVISNRDLSISGLCGVSSFNYEIDNTIFPLCSGGVADFVLNTSNCSSQNQINVTLTNNAPLNNRHNITGLEYDREYSVRVINLTFNESNGLYQDGFVEYYEDGEVNVTGNCTEAESTETIIINNVAPTVLHVSIDVDGSSAPFEDNVLLNVTNLSTITFFISIFDVNLANATHNIYNSTGGIIFNDTHDEFLDNHSISGSILDTGNYTFETIAFDLLNLNTTLQTLFFINKFVASPIMQEVTITPSNPTTISNLNCSAIATDQEVTNLVLNFEWFEDGVIQNAYNVTVNTTNNTLTYTTSLVNETLNLGDEWICRVRAFNGVEYSDYFNSTLVSIGRTPADNALNLDLTQLENVMILFILVIAWVGVSAIGVAFNNFGFKLLGILLGLIIGFFLMPIHPILTILFVIINTFFFITVVGFDR